MGYVLLFIYVNYIESNSLPTQVIGMMWEFFDPVTWKLSGFEYLIRVLDFE